VGLERADDLGQPLRPDATADAEVLVGRDDAAGDALGHQRAIGRRRGSAEPIGVRASTAELGRQVMKGVQREDGRQLGQLGVGTGPRLAGIVRREAVVPHLPQRVREPGIGGGDQPALTGRHILGGVQAERLDQGLGGQAAASVQSAEAMRVVEQEHRPGALGDGAERRQVGRNAEHVHGHDGPHVVPFAQDRFERSRIERERLGVDIAEHGFEPAPDQRVRRRHERIGGEHDAPPALHGDGRGQLERQGTVRHRDDLGRAEERAGGALELADRGTVVGQSSRAEDVGEAFEQRAGRLFLDADHRDWLWAFRGGPLASDESIANRNLALAHPAHQASFSGTHRRTKPCGRQGANHGLRAPRRRGPSWGEAARRGPPARWSERCQGQTVVV